VKRLMVTSFLSLNLLMLEPCVSLFATENPCATCHPKEVAGYSHSAMSRSLRRPGKEAEGDFEHSLSGTRFTIYSNSKGLFQRMEREGDVSDYEVAYVVGSGKHASGYLVRIGDHLFQSPLCYYTRLNRYDMAPGYEENRAPDFIRAVSEECLLCHSGKPLPIKGTLNEYQSPEFAQEAISCQRCHGDTKRHLKAPLPGSIVNPAKLAPAARNSVCEQCHLKGIARTLNPGMSFEDFHPGKPLEEVYTTYVAAQPPDAPRESLKVISHVEQLALSLCARQSGGRLWCGTCHNPHDTSNKSAEYYAARCQSCHRGKLAPAATHPGGADRNCVGCHMAKRNAKDGGHTVFTDHRISRRPAPEQGEATSGNNDLVAWREPSPKLRQRNLALAYLSAGFESYSASQIVRGYQMIRGVEQEFPSDPPVLIALGKALLNAKQPVEAARVFERVLALGPDSAVTEANAGEAWLDAGQAEKGVAHLERAVELDPLFLPAAEMLMRSYQQNGDADKLEALSDRVRQALGNSAPHDVRPPEH